MKSSKLTWALLGCLTSSSLPSCTVSEKPEEGPKGPALEESVESVNLLMGQYLQDIKEGDPVELSSEYLESAKNYLRGNVDSQTGLLNPELISGGNSMHLYSLLTIIKNQGGDPSFAQEIAVSAMRTLGAGKGTDVDVGYMASNYFFLLRNPGQKTVSDVVRDQLQPACDVVQREQQRDLGVNRVTSQFTYNVCPK
ncbi:hypothetical protein ACFLZX_05715 [Nanoarchaeota archaeon]